MNRGSVQGCESVGGIDGADGSAARPAEESGAAKPRYEVINREQLCWQRVDVERLIGEEHAARAVWEFVGQLDLSRGTGKRCGRWRAKRDDRGGNRGY